MAKQRSDTHLSEDASETIVRGLLPRKWVIRKFHPDYGIDLSIEVFERTFPKIPTMGELLFVQLKSTRKLRRGRIKVRARSNVEKYRDVQDGEVAGELEIVKYVIDVNTIDNARLMGPSSPLLLFVVDIVEIEVYYICLTDYFDKVLEPRGFDFSKQKSLAINIPKSNRLTARNATAVMTFFACRSKLYSMFSIAHYQHAELWSLEHHDPELISKLIRRFAEKLRSMPIWERPTIWSLVAHHKSRLDKIICSLDMGLPEQFTAETHETPTTLDDVMDVATQLLTLYRRDWQQFALSGRIFEDVVREWFLPTHLGQLGSGEEGIFRPL